MSVAFIITQLYYNHLSVRNFCFRFTHTHTHTYAQDLESQRKALDEELEDLIRQRDVKDSELERVLREADEQAAKLNRADSRIRFDMKQIDRGCDPSKRSALELIKVRCIK